MSNDKSVSELLAEFEEAYDRVGQDNGESLPHEILKDMSPDEITAWIKAKNKMNNALSALRR